MCNVLLKYYFMPKAINFSGLSNQFCKFIIFQFQFSSSLTFSKKTTITEFFVVEEFLFNGVAIAMIEPTNSLFSVGFLRSSFIQLQ